MSGYDRALSVFRGGVRLGGC
ncbi:YALIA101S01e09626g2_1 [Yarrowia lipolytica]|nr:YALIA101S01e09626g2_1 [Yarrowia lipolytica]VBB85692.1 Alpha 4 subunit of the 20S proteasome, putative [Yarrowia lipolytica]